VLNIALLHVFIRIFGIIGTVPAVSHSSIGLTIGYAHELILDGSK
jgi:flagellar biosynthesis protein FliR